MLLQLMQETGRFFKRAAYEGQYSIADGALLPLPVGMLLGQYVAVTGSRMTDGLYMLGAGGVLLDESGGALALQDEAFKGTVYDLAVPASFRALAAEISAWKQKNPTGGVTSESFGSYSYAKSQGKKGAITWQEAFADRLTPYRRMFKEVPL